MLVWDKYRRNCLTREWRKVLEEMIPNLSLPGGQEFARREVHRRRFWNKAIRGWALQMIVCFHTYPHLRVGIYPRIAGMQLESCWGVFKFTDAWLPLYLLWNNKVNLQSHSLAQSLLEIQRYKGPTSVLHGHICKICKRYCFVLINEDPQTACYSRPQTWIHLFTQAPLNTIQSESLEIWPGHQHALKAARVSLMFDQSWIHCAF